MKLHYGTLGTLLAVFLLGAAEMVLAYPSDSRIETAARRVCEAMSDRESADQALQQEFMAMLADGEVTPEEVGTSESAYELGNKIGNASARICPARITQVYSEPVEAHP